MNELITTQLVCAKSGGAVFLFEIFEEAPE